MGKISIILPVFNGEKYLRELVRAIRNQNTEYSVEIIAAVSESVDNSYKLAKKLCDKAYIVENFNHGKTRHEAALKAEGEILVFITQDILPYNKYWLHELVYPLITLNEVVATYSRQIAYSEATLKERLIREFNYPDHDRLCNRDTIEKWGRKNIFYSDTSSATLKHVFFELGGYNFDVETNEDVIYAINVIDSGKSILYNSKSKVYHSHNFRIGETFRRYKLIGKFEKIHRGKLIKYNSINEGKTMVIFLVKVLLKSFKLKELFLLSIDFAIRYLAYKRGYNSNESQ